MPSTFTARYRIPASGLWLREKPIEVQSPDLSRELRLGQEDDQTLVLEVVIRSVTEADGEDVAEELAATFLETLTLEHADLIVTAGPPVLDSTSYTDDQGGRTGLGAIRLSASAVVATGVDRQRSEVILGSTLTSRAAPTPMARTARRMHSAALRVHDAVVRYLMLYGALMVAGEAIQGTATQPVIDQLLVQEDPSIPVSPDPRGPQHGTETAFTKARNDFIHAENARRGNDAERAAAEIRTLVGPLTKVVARVIKRIK